MKSEIAEMELSGVGFEGPNSGTVAVGGTAHSLGPIMLTPFGTAFGAFELRAMPNTTLGIDSLAYTTTQETSLLDTLLGSLGGATVSGGLLAGSVEEADDAETLRATRRDVLGLAGAAMGAAAVPAAASAKTPSKAIVEATIGQNTEGFQLRIAPGVADQLPANTKYHVIMDEETITSFKPTDEAVTVRDGMTGRLVVRREEPGIMADARALASTRELETHVDLPRPASKLPRGSSTVVATHPLVVDPMTGIDEADFAAAIGEMEVPLKRQVDDADESTNGYLALEKRDGNRALVYTAGDDGPGERTLTLILRAGPVAEAQNDVQLTLPGE